MKRTILLLILTFISATAIAAPFEKGDAQAGKKFFEENRCNRCHVAKMGGDGSAIFTRPNRIVHNPKELIARLLVCSGAAEVTLTEQDKQNLGAYLNQTYYKFQ
jgi:cytochrome c553